MSASLTVLLDGIVFGEGPRWRDDHLWFSDMHGHQVHRVRVDEGDGTKLAADSVFVEITDDIPSGLGWMPDGSLLVVAMNSQQLRRVAADGSVSVHADASHLARGSLNDMIVRSDGTAYVGDMGSRIFDEHPDHSVPGQTLVVRPDGSVSVGASPLKSPNGHVLTPDERTLIVGESGGGRLTTFDVAEDGSISGERLFAELPPAEGRRIAPPDGICLDSAGAVWVADPIGGRLLRALEGGEVTDIVPIEGVPVAVVLGGPDRRTLYACVADDWKRDALISRRSGRILAMPVAVAGAGKP
jgi:sugar lactone lactonase YvrE